MERNRMVDAIKMLVTLQHLQMPSSRFSSSARGGDTKRPIIMGVAQMYK